MVPSIVAVPTIARSMVGCLRATETVSVWNRRGILGATTTRRLSTSFWLFACCRCRNAVSLYSWHQACYSPGQRPCRFHHRVHGPKIDLNPEGDRNFNIEKPSIAHTSPNLIVIDSVVEVIEFTKEKKAEWYEKFVMHTSNTAIKFNCEKNRQNIAWKNGWFDYLENLENWI